MKKLKRSAAIVALFVYAQHAGAVEFEKMGSAVAKALKVKKAKKAATKVGGKDITAYYAEGADGKPTRFAVVQNGIYPPNCTHTWVVALDTNAKVDDIRVVEMSCTHAYPTKEQSFLSQFKGKGPVDAKSLKSSVQTIAKATGSSELTADAVVSSIQAVGNLKKSL